MTALDAFVTFGLPAIAVSGALLALFVTTRNADRLRERMPKPQTGGGKS